ncbi:MAG: LPS assembly lipoprotein LptE [Desulfopila sp.]
MKPRYRLIALTSLLLMVLAACGYHNPNVYTGPHRAIYLTEWKNRTSELGLDARLYQSLVRWFQNSDSLSITKRKSEAQLMLAGEIVSISLPSRSYNNRNVTSEVKVELRVRYALKDLATDEIVLEEPGQTWTENYLVGGSASDSSSNQQEAIATIISDISERIYQTSLRKLNQMPR